MLNSKLKSVDGRIVQFVDVDDWIMKLMSEERRQIDAGIEKTSDSGCDNEKPLLQRDDRSKIFFLSSNVR